MAGRIDVLVAAVLRSIGGADGWNSIVVDKFCVERDKDPSDEFGILGTDDVVESWIEDRNDDELLSLCDELETKRKLEFEEMLKRRTSKPAGGGIRKVRPGGKSGNAGNTDSGLPFIEWGTLPTVNGTVIIRFL